MRRTALLTVLLLAGAALAGPPNWGRTGGWNPFSRWFRPTTTAASTGPGEVLRLDFQPGLAASKSAIHPLPACTVAANCVVQCVASVTGNAWQCTKGDGTSATVTQGTAPVVEDAQGRSALNIFSDANAPVITAANSVFLDNFEQAAHTVIFTGTAFITSNTIPYVFVHGSTTDGFHFRSDAGTKCIWRNTVAAPSEINVLVAIPAVTAGTGFYACRKTGTGVASSYTTWANGTTATSAWAFDPGATAGTQANFGRNIGTTLWLGGQYESLTIFSVAKTDAQLASYQADWAGLNPATSTTVDDLRYARGGQLWTLNAAGQYYPIAPEIPVMESAGMAIGEHTNESGSGATWATDNLDASSWTVVGTPTTTVNVDSGPFSSWRNTAEGDRVVDDDAAAFEGYEAVTSAGVAVDRFTVSCFLKQGDTGITTTKARLILRQSGTTDVATCDKTLTSAWVRYTCSGTTSGPPTSVRGRVLVGNATADTGSILVSQCQVNADGWAAAPLIGNGAVGVDDLSSTLAEVAAWTKTGGTRHEVIFTPDFSRSDIFDLSDTYEPVDLDEVTHTDHRVLLWHYYNLPHAMATRGAAAPLTETDTYAASDIPESAGHTYAFSARWVPVGGGFVNHYLYFNECPGSVSACEATTLIASDTTGTKRAPVTADWGWLRIGCRYNKIACMSGHIARVRIWES